MQPDLQRKQKRNLVFAGIAVFVAIVLLVLFLFSRSANSTVTVEIVVVPSDSSLTIDGQPAKAGKVTISEGKHNLKATRQYFGDAEREIDTTNLNLSQPVYLVLDPNTPEAQKYMADNPQEQMLRERAVGAEVSETQESLLERYPIIESLPYETIDYKIDYSVTEDKDVTLQVTFYPPAAVVPGTQEYKDQLNQFKADALSYLEEQGVDIDRIPITFSPDPDQ